MKQMGIVFSHSDYIKKSHGTERCIREIRAELLRNDADFIQVFPIRNKILLKCGLEMVGVNHGDDFLGIYRLREIPVLFHQICVQDGYEEGIVQIHHLLFYNLSTLAEVIKNISRPTIMMIHDYFTICTQVNLIDSNGHFCGVERPSENKCAKCEYFESGLKQYVSVKKFLNEIKGVLKQIITPSDFVRRTWSIAFPDYQDYVTVRPHLEFVGNRKEHKKNDKIRLCYVGVQNDFKGFNEWQELADRLKDNSYYELHYFGGGKQELPGVKNHYVSISDQGEDAMIKELIRNNTDVCLFWPNWSETYSYVFYELLCSGTMVVTNTIAGNVTDMVTQIGNGRIFESKEEMFSYFASPVMIESDLQFYRENKSYPEKIIPNRDVSMFISNDHLQSKTKRKAGKWRLLTTYYLKKVRPEL